MTISSGNRAVNWILKLLDLTAYSKDLAQPISYNEYQDAIAYVNYKSEKEKDALDG